MSLAWVFSTNSQTFVTFIRVMRRQIRKKYKDNHKDIYSTHLSSEGELKTGDRIVARQCHVVLVLVRQLPNLDCVVQHRPGDDGDGGDNNIPDGLISYSQFPLFRYSKVTCSR